MSTPTKGKKATWSGIYVSDRPRDVLGLTLALEANFDNILGITGRNQAGETKQKNILWYNSTSAPTLTDYAALPVGTIIVADKLAVPKIYLHAVASTVPVVGDWFGITMVAET